MRGQFSYRIWVEGQSEPDAVPWSSLKYARQELARQRKIYDMWGAVIIKVGPGGFPRDYTVVAYVHEVTP